MPVYRIHMMLPLYRDIIVRADDEEEACDLARRGEGRVVNETEGYERITDIEEEGEDD